MRAILSLLLALILCLGSALGLLPDREAAPALSPAARAVPAAEPMADVSWPEMEYVHWDPTGFYSRTEQLAALEDSGEAAALYDSLCGEYTDAMTWASLAYIRYSQDVTDSYWSGENTYCAAMTARMGDELAAAGQALLLGPCAEDFAAHVGPEAASALEAYRPLTDRQLELTDREAELVTDYYTVMAGMDSLTYSYLGESWTFEKLSGFPGRSLASRDYDGYLEVFYGLNRALNDAAGPIFLELVDLRTELAVLAGYDSYTDYAYREVYHRDYTPEDAQALCDAVKPLAAELRKAARSGEPAGQAMDAGTLVQTLGRYVGRLHPALEDAWRRWSDSGLYCFTASGKAMAGAYTADLPRYGSAFIFQHLAGDGSDLATLSHEFGHFANACLSPCPDLLTAVGSLELMETHSNGLEALFTQYYGEIYGPEAGRAQEERTLGGLLGSVVDGCLYDEFQRQVYARPDMTLEEINCLFADLAAQYGMYEPMDEDYTWVHVLHSFEVPLYYISYAASSLSAIQIWDMARTDPAAGAAAYMALLDRGAYSEGYMAVLESCGLTPFTEDGAAEAICRPLLEYLNGPDGEGPSAP